MESKHTPGPWKLTIRFQDKIDIFHSGPGCDKPGAASKTVCRVTCRETWLEEQTANALLIANAPDMLNALRIGVMALAKASDGDGTYSHAYKVLSEAIAKATGTINEA